ncbi:helix-turn-helix transcriptional regulator [Paenibacillus sp. TAB 01]|uniref:helix-turn-helix transcriptional regulator n=1 Tax=Paenibacillus sp. TAB 01 TaxID=3368988 RepID=UPI0037519354
MKRLWLNKIRTSRSKTHLEVASNSGIKRQYYGMIENGVSNPSVEVAKAIATYLEFDWTLFFADEGNETLHFNDEQAATREVV